MLKHGFKAMLAEANAVIETVSMQDLPYHMDEPDVVLVDVRETVERECEGAIPGSVNAPRGLLEFLEQISFLLNRLTGFPRLLARRDFRRGLVDHKGAATLSGGRGKPAFGGPFKPISGVAKFVRCPTSHGTSRLGEWAWTTPSSDSIGTKFALTDPESPVYNDALQPDRRIILYCGTGGRSALAAKTLIDMGFRDVASLAGGYAAWCEADRS